MDYKTSGVDIEAGREFVSEIKSIQDDLTSRLAQDPDCVDWIDTENLYPDARLLQLLDGLSLSICSRLIPPRQGVAKGFGEDEFDLIDVPRKNWQDRITITLIPQGEGRIACNPYPFDVDPLPVVVPTRIFQLPLKRSSSFQTWWHAQIPQLIRYEYCSV